MYSDDEPRHHYRSSRDGGGCGRTIADQRVLDAEISAMTLQRLTDPQQLALIRKIQADHRAKREPYLEEISEREKIRSYWDQRLTNGVISIDQHAEAVAELDEAITSARAVLTQLDTVPVPDLDDETAGRIATGWQSAAPAARYADLRKVWRGFQMFVTPGSSVDSATEVRKRISPPRLILSVPRL
ncbi:hypothetical protein [Streptomyces sp. NPDC059009]|uniref:hypothetical protein n=1 Tax=Streptomyces sp. NPDC059009 TaxID=3346694 RepID=UPI00367873F2